MKHQSISTVSVNHDDANIITELILINKYGVLPEFCWRKGQPFHEEWSKLVVVVKNVIQKLKIRPGQLAWYVNKAKISDIDYKEFGLVQYRASKVFPNASIHDIVDLYRKMNVIRKERMAAPRLVNTSPVYTMKQDEPQKSLIDILKELNG